MYIFELELMFYIFELMIYIKRFFLQKIVFQTLLVFQTSALMIYIFEFMIYIPSILQNGAFPPKSYDLHV